MGRRRAQGATSLCLGCAALVACSPAADPRPTSLAAAPPPAAHGDDAPPIVSFPSPPPRWSASVELPLALERARAQGGRLSSVAAVLKAQLDGAGYEGQYRWFGYPGGFALATQAERFAVRDGALAADDGPERWHCGIPKPKGAWEWITSLASIRPGYCRVFVFVVSENLDARGGPADQETAAGWAEQGLVAFPSSADRPLERKHHLFALVYAYRRENADRPAELFKGPPMTQHLQTAQLWRLVL